MLGLVVFTIYSMLLGSVCFYLNRPYGLAWWLKITTQQPLCVYYFGPFGSITEAERSMRGYKEDLESEQATIVDVSFNQSFPPQQLTIFVE